MCVPKMRSPSAHIASSSSKSAAMLTKASLSHSLRHRLPRPCQLSTGKAQWHSYQLPAPSPHTLFQLIRCSTKCPQASIGLCMVLMWMVPMLAHHNRKTSQGLPKIELEHPLRPDRKHAWLTGLRSAVQHLCSPVVAEGTKAPGTTHTTQTREVRQC